MAALEVEDPVVVLLVADQVEQDQVEQVQEQQVEQAVQQLEMEMVEPEPVVLVHKVERDQAVQMLVHKADWVAEVTAHTAIATDMVITDTTIDITVITTNRH